MELAYEGNEILKVSHYRTLLPDSFMLVVRFEVKINSIHRRNAMIESMQLRLSLSEGKPVFKADME